MQQIPTAAIGNRGTRGIFVLWQVTARWLPMGSGKWYLPSLIAAC